MTFFPKLPTVPLFHRSARPETTSRPVSRQMSMSLTNKGLLNPTGHNNCFLNSCVQVLWHVDVFRRSFRQFKGHTCVGESCIFCALQALFVQFQHSSQSALPPDDLREALARCYQEQHRFQLGIMDDAAECFEKILEQIHFHLTGSDDLDSCSAAHCLSHQKCSLSVLEMTECQCGETSEPLAFVQFVHYISATSLGAAAKKEKKQGASYSLGDGELFGRLVRVVSGEGEWRECETCHKKSPVKKMLLNNPDLVCMGMIWDSDQPNIDDIMSVVESVGIFVRVSDIFHRVMSEASSTEYCLSGMVAYYGHHYCTFCYHTVLRQWGFFDDANFRTIGSNWAHVVELCRKAHYQPLLLVYSDPFADKIAMTTAPVQVTRVVATETKTKSLTPVMEEVSEISADTQKTGDDKQPADSGPHSKASGSQPSSSSVSNKTPSTEGSQSSNVGATAGPRSHSGSKFGQDPGYDIDPNTFSIRRKPVPALYPQLSQVGGGEGEKSPVASAPPLEALSSPVRPKTSSNFPVVFQSSPGHPGPSAVSQPGSGSFPVLFQSSPSLPARPPPSSGFSRFPPFVVPPSLLQRTQGAAQRGTQYPTNTSGYPRPTYSAQPRPQTNTRYPNPTTHNSPWRGGEGGGGGFPSFFQPGSNHQQQQPTTFLQQSSPHSSPRSSPSLFEKKTPGVSGRDAVSGPSSLPGSPAKRESHSQRASSMQPVQVGATSSYSTIPSLLIARPRPSPPHSVPPPNQTHKTNPDHGPSLNRDSDNLMEFSVSPSLLSPSKTRQPSSTQGPAPQVSSPAGSSFLSSDSRTHQPSSTQGPTPQVSSPAGSSYLSSTTDSDTSRETSPYGGRESSCGLSSLEEDLIQWSLSPDFLQKVQKYRGRQGLHQGSYDSLRGSGTASVITGMMGDSSGTRVSGSSNSKLNGAAVSGPSSNTSSDGESVLVDETASGRDCTEQQMTATRLRNVTLNGEVGREKEQTSKGEQKRVGHVPDPRYADPDEIQTFLKVTPEPEKVEPTGVTASVSGGGGGGEGEVVAEVGERPGLGEDPLYAVPEQVAARLRAKKAVSSSATQTPAHSGEIPESVEPVLREALEVWQRAESKRDSNITLARNSYSRAATLLTKVLLDPALDPTLKQNISTKRQEALTKCSAMEALINRSKRSVYGGSGKCSQCGQLRQLNSQQMCGPCHLKNKISQT